MSRHNYVMMAVFTVVLSILLGTVSVAAVNAPYCRCTDQPKQPDPPGPPGPPGPQTIALLAAGPTDFDAGDADGDVVDDVDDEWFHGMTKEVYEATKQCMRQLRAQTAASFGQDQTGVSDSPIVDCVIYTLEQCEYQLNRNQRRKKRFIIDFDDFPDSKWTDLPILYEFRDSVIPAERTMVRNAFDHYENVTCLRFREYDEATDGPDTQRLFFTDDVRCYAFIGKTGFLQQQVNLGPGCANQLATVLHEIGHAVGMHHTQQRPDRDDFVTFNPDNVNPNELPAYIILDSGFYTTLDLPYDYYSVMHYQLKAATCRQALVPTEPYNERGVRLEGFMSFGDMQVLNKAYCNDACAANPPNCQTGRLPNPNNCYECLCPPGLTGPLCADIGVRSPGCNPSNEIIFAREYEQCVESPNYGISPYNSGDQCSWVIQAPQGCKVNAYFKDLFRLPCVGNGCFGFWCLHWVEVKYKGNKSLNGGRFCCSSDEDDPPESSFNDPGVIESESEEMLIHFDGTFPPVPSPNSRFLPISPEKRYGFRLCFTSVCPSTTTVKENPYKQSYP